MDFHKITDGTFTYTDEEGKSQTVKGALVVMPTSDNEYRPGQFIGSVGFRVADLPDAQAQKQAQ